MQIIQGMATLTIIGLCVVLLSVNRQTRIRWWMTLAAYALAKADSLKHLEDRQKVYMCDISRT